MNPVHRTDNLTFEQFMHNLEEWSSQDQLLECLTTLTRFYVTGYSIEDVVKWLELRESILADPEEAYEDHQDRGESFGA